LPAGEARGRGEVGHPDFVDVVLPAAVGEVEAVVVFIRGEGGMRVSFVSFVTFDERPCRAGSFC